MNGMIGHDPDTYGRHADQGAPYPDETVIGHDPDTYGRHADQGAPYPDETVIVDPSLGSIYRIGGGTLALLAPDKTWRLTGQ